MPTSTRAVGTSVFTIRRGKFAIAQRADRGVRPYRTFCVFAETACNFAIAHRRGDVGIDPYKRCTGSHRCIQFCGRVLPGGQGRPPLRVHTVSHWRVRICDCTPRGRDKLPTLRRNTKKPYPILYQIPRGHTTIFRTKVSALVSGRRVVYNGVKRGEWLCGI